MRELAQKHGNSTRELTFTSPIDYLVARYYFGEENNKLRLYNPKNPQETFWHWPLIKPNAMQLDPESAAVITPDETRIVQGYQYHSEVGSYKIYVKNLQLK